MTYIYLVESWCHDWSGIDSSTVSFAFTTDDEAQKYARDLQIKHPKIQCTIMQRPLVESMAEARFERV